MAAATEGDPDDGRRELNELRAALDVAGVAAWYWEIAGARVRWSPALESLHGLAPGRGEGPFEDFLEQVWPDDREAVMQALARALEEEREFRVEYRVAMVDGQRWLEARGRAALDAKRRPCGVWGVSLDIDRYKRAQTEHWQANQELLEKNRELEQLVYTVSHDLKSPVVTLLGFANLLREDLAEGRADEVADSLDRLERAARRMSQLVDDLLKVSRIGRLRNTQVDVDVGQLVGEIASDLAERLEQVGARVEIEPGMPSVLADRARLAEVFENLLVNAIKYACRRPATIRIGSRRAADEVRFFVADQGPGIDPQHHARIFGLFQRLDTSGEGTGIGLAIVQRIMQMHGGRSWVESRPGAGATFWLAFPRQSLAGTGR